MPILEQILRFIFSYIDSIIAWAISLIYNLFMELANLILYSEKIINSIGQRIGLILGIFMLFRIAVSLVDYLISPDKLKDNSKGGAKIIKNVIIAIVLIVTYNFIFRTAYKVQKSIISSNFLPKIFFGKQADVPNIDVGYYTYTAFFTPNEKILGEECNNMWDATVPMDNACIDNLRNSGLHDEEIRSIATAKGNLNMSEVFNNQSLVTAKKNKEYIFQYYPIVSNAVGIAVILMLLSYSIDLATRAIKLLFLQIIAPIPIISLVDPGKGQDIFKKWYQEALKTYLVVFIRILVMNFVLYMITIIKTEFKEIFANSLFLNVFLIIGCLVFAKQAPKLIEDIFGIKLDGMTLRPFKKIEDNALFGKQVLGLGRGATAAAIGAGAGLLGGAITSARLGNGVLGFSWAGIRGAFRGAAGGLTTGYGRKNFFQAVGTGFGRFGTNADYVTSLDGTTLGGRIKAGAQQLFHQKTDADDTKDQLDSLGKFSSSVDALLKRAESESIKHNDLTITSSNGSVINMAQHKQRQEELTRLRNTLLNKDDFYKDVEVDDQDAINNDMATYGMLDPTKNYKKIVRQFDEAAFNRKQQENDEKIAILNTEIEKDKKTFANEYATQVSRGNYSDDGETRAYVDAVVQNRDDLAKYFTDAQMANFNITDANGFNGKAAKDAKAKADTAKYRIENTKNIRRGNREVNQYEEQKANAAATKRRTNNK